MGNKSCDSCGMSEESSSRVAHKPPRHCEDEIDCSNTCLVAAGQQINIEELVQNCIACQEVRNKPLLVMLHPWSWPAHPWQRVYGLC